ncbi:unnamed protein product [Lactuca saligna]|uniref:Uncharacterized protein n=1 Tax=Lactuca saligna TaxID=75948 RepID=A0AA35YNH0_LACSI|nr:unnamed protein product [Lactuca saligna]
MPTKLAVIVVEDGPADGESSRRLSAAAATIVLGGFEPPPPLLISLPMIASLLSPGGFSTPLTPFVLRMPLRQGGRVRGLLYVYIFEWVISNGRHEEPPWHPTMVVGAGNEVVAADGRYCCQFSSATVITTGGCWVYFS